MMLLKHYAKAFYAVYHSQVLNELERYVGSLLKWIKLSLLDRSSQPRMNVSLSKW